MSVSCSEFASGEMEVSWAPSHATVGMVVTEEEATQVFQLRYRVFVHELGRRGEGIDRARGELTGQLDASSHLWQARDGHTLVGTMTLTMIGPEFDLSQIPSEFELDRVRADAGLIGYSSRFAIDPNLAACGYFRVLRVTPTPVGAGSGQGSIPWPRIPVSSHCSNGWVTSATRHRAFRAGQWDC
ncbi:MAG: hypothetical protein ABI969_07210 [bacterium]